MSDNRYQHIKKRMFERYGLKVSNSDIKLINDNIMSRFATYIGEDHINKRIHYFIVPFMNDAVGIIWDSRCKYPLTCVTINQMLDANQKKRFGKIRNIKINEWCYNEN